MGCVCVCTCTFCVNNLICVLLYAQKDNKISCILYLENLCETICHLFTCLAMH